MRIGIDMDDVCSNFQKKEVEIMHEMFGRPPLGTMPIDWESSNLQVSAEEYKQFWSKAAHTKNLWSSLEPLPSFNAETIRLLNIALQEHDVFFVTNRFETSGASPLKQTKYWLYVNAFIQAPNVLIARYKGPVASVLQLDAFIDDRPKNLIDVLAARPTCKVYLADSSHNQTFNDPRFPRVANLKEFLKLILEAN